MNTIQPYSIKKINNSTMAFKKMENIGLFLNSIDNYGVPKTDQFQTADLYDGTNMSAVVNTIYALCRAVCTYIIINSKNVH